MYEDLEASAKRVDQMEDSLTIRGTERLRKTVGQTIKKDWIKIVCH